MTLVTLARKKTHSKRVVNKKFLSFGKNTDTL